MYLAPRHPPGILVISGSDVFIYKVFTKLLVFWLRARHSVTFYMLLFGRNNSKLFVDQCIKC